MTEVRRRVTKPAAERRREIMDAAIDLFVKRGYDDTTVQDIAVAANVATGSVYIHFPSKQSILHAINDGFYEGMTATVSDLVDELLQAPSPEDLSFDAVVDKMIDSISVYVKQNAKACEIAAKYVAHAEMAQAGLRFVEFLTRVTEQAVAVGLLYAPDPENLSYLVHAAVSGTMMSSIAYNKPADYDRLMETTKYMLRRLFAPEPT